MAFKTSEWRKLPLGLTELCIDTTLRCGQSFRWRKISDEWHCALNGRVVSLKQDPEYLHYRVTWPSPKPTLVKAAAAPPTSPLTPPSSARPTVAPEDGLDDHDDTESLLTNYFNLTHDLTALYHQWSTADPNFRKRAPSFTGVRMLNQDAWETLVGFICSSNNNIARISQMVHKLCIHYGGSAPLATLYETPFYDFPPPAALAGPGVEAHLRELGFGYRARYIAQTARHIVEERPLGWLDSLRNPLCPPPWLTTTTVTTTSATTETSSSSTTTSSPTYKDAHENLLTLAGVGPKVADCVCLMGLGWGEAVPVDTHVWQIAVRDYRFGGSGGKNKTLTKAMYEAVGEHFRGLWGAQAGWAHSVLFAADLPALKKEEKTEVSVVKEEEATVLVTPAGTPMKRKRTVKVKVEEEAAESSVAVTAVRSSKRRRTRS